jgi:mannan endo-1,4-beta-mannosidase
VCGSLLSASCAKVPGPARSSLDVELHPPASFEADGKPLCFAGSNNYYAIYKPKPVVDDLFEAAQALDLKVLRVWGMLDRGSLDGTVPNVDGNGQKDGVYFQYWDPLQKRPAYNDGEDGLEHLDYVLAAAAKHDIKLIIVLVNNWHEFGGIDQYLTWYGKNRHHEFFTAPETKQAYRAWLSHLIGRKNSKNGRLYREDPSIFSWELANEPRCNDGGNFDAPDGWDSTTLTGWADEMSAYVKSLDPNHLVSVGDEGFLDGGGQHWAYDAKDGVDHAALTALPSVDFGTFHLYPEDWATPPGFDEKWILDHLQVARDLGKPTLLEEYGAKVARTPERLGEVSRGWQARHERYRRWNELLLENGGNAALSWMLAGRDIAGARYPDYDGFAFYRDDATGKLLSEYAHAFPSAPACRGQRQPSASSAPSSPFVSVAKPPRTSASGWLFSSAF